MTLKGIITPIITPFQNNAIDYAALKNLIEFQINSGVSGLVVLGTTGEAPTINKNERREIISFCADTIAKRVPMLVGCGTNCTETSVNYAVQAERLGADGVMIVTPYYNKCTDKGLITHFKRIVSEISIPFLPYNVPQRTGYNISIETALALSEMDNFYGIKEASNDFPHIIKMCKALGDKVFSGNDYFNMEMLEMGAKGCISALANIIPRRMVSVFDAFVSGNKKLAYALNNNQTDFIKIMYCEVNPIPIKYALFKKGMIENELRLPLTPLEEIHCKSVDDLLKDYDEINS